MPKAVYFLPESKIKIEGDGMKISKDELHRKFMRTSDSDYSSDEEQHSYKKKHSGHITDGKKLKGEELSGNTSESGIVIRDPSQINTMDAHNQDSRSGYKTSTVPPMFTLNAHKTKVASKLQQFNKMAEKNLK